MSTLLLNTDALECDDSVPLLSTAFVYQLRDEEASLIAEVEELAEEQQKMQQLLEEKQQQSVALGESDP